MPKCSGVLILTNTLAFDKRVMEFFLEKLKLTSFIEQQVYNTFFYCDLGLLGQDKVWSCCDLGLGQDKVSKLLCCVSFDKNNTRVLRTL